MKKIKIILSVIIFSLAGYGLLANREELVPYVLLGTAIIMLLTGFQEISQGKRKFDGYLFLTGSVVFFTFGILYIFM